MNQQCPRCLSSAFTLLNIGNRQRNACSFCIDTETSIHYFQKIFGNPASPSLLVGQVTVKRIEAPTVLNGRDRTTSGAIGQP